MTRRRARQHLLGGQAEARGDLDDGDGALRLAPCHTPGVERSPAESTRALAAACDPRCRWSTDPDRERESGNGADAGAQATAQGQAPRCQGRRAPQDRRRPRRRARSELSGSPPGGAETRPARRSPLGGVAPGRSRHPRRRPPGRGIAGWRDLRDRLRADIAACAQRACDRYAEGPRAHRGPRRTGAGGATSRRVSVPVRRPPGGTRRGAARCRHRRPTMTGLLSRKPCH